MSESQRDAIARGVAALVPAERERFIAVLASPTESFEAVPAPE